MIVVRLCTIDPSGPAPSATECVAVAQLVALAAAGSEFVAAAIALVLSLEVDEAADL